MNCSTIDIDQMLRRRGGKLLYEGPEGRVAQCPDGLILSDITSGKALCGCLSFLLLPEDAHFCVKSKDAANGTYYYAMCENAVKTAMMGQVNMPSNVLYQANFSQGKGVWKSVSFNSGWYSSTSYFCYG